MRATYAKVSRNEGMNNERPLTRFFFGDGRTITANPVMSVLLVLSRQRHEERTFLMYRVAF